MPKRIEAWGNVLEFPDDMPDADIASAIQKNEAHLNPEASTFTKAKSAVSSGIDAGLSMLTPKPSIADQAQANPAQPADPARIQRSENIVSKALASTEPVPEEGGFINSAGRTIGQNIKGAGQVAADYLGAAPNNAVKQYGQAVIDANPTAVNSLGDIANKPGTAVSEATGNAAPSMAGMIGARAVGQGITALSPLAGPAAPLVAAAGQVVSWLGPAAIAALPSYGGIRDKQILNDPKNEKDAKSIAIATMGAAAVGAIEQAFGPQQWALAAMTKQGRARMAEKFAATTLAGSIGKGVVKGAAIEGSEELAQNPIEQLAAGDNPTTPENLKDTVFGAVMGGIGGGVFGGGAGMILGKPATQQSDGVLKYTAARGGEKAKAIAQAELERRAKQGVDPAVANAPETTPEAVQRIIETGKDKAREIRKDAAASPDSIQSDVFDEAPDSPTPEPVETLDAQLKSLADGNKPGMLLTPGETLPGTLPEGIKSAEIPGRGTLLYRDEETLKAAIEGRIGEALGYGIDEKPAGADQVVTARDENGTVIQDVATDGSKSVLQAAKDVAGPDGSIEVRPVEQAMAERAAGTGKAAAEIVLPDSTVLPTQWDVVDADSVTASLKEGVNQPRDRSRAASDVQVQGIANKPDYRRLSDSPVMDIGAPTLSVDGHIVGGNGRFEGVNRAYDQGSAGEYLANLKADAVAKGIDPAKIDGMKKPVLVRRITQPFDTRKLAVASNSGTSLQYSGLELAKIDAERMKGLENLDVTDSGDIALTGSNIQNVRAALGDYSAAELGALTDKNGMLSQEGVRRIRNAMLYAAYGSNPTLERMVESTDNDMRNISGALIRAAGSATKVRADIKAGSIPAELDISEDIITAVETLSKIKAQGMSVDEHLAQIGMFGEELSDAAKQILRVFETNMRSQKKIAEFVKSYYDAVAKLDLASGDMFGNSTPDKQGLLNDSKERITEKPLPIQDLFARPVSSPGAESRPKPADNGGTSRSGQKEQQVKPPASPKEEAAPSDPRKIAENRWKEINNKWGSSQLGKAWKPSTPLAIRIEAEELQTKLTKGNKEYIPPDTKAGEAPKEETTPTPAPNSTELPGARPLVESLIKRRAAAKQGGKDLSNAIDRAKEVMAGKRAPSTVEHRYFRLQAKAFERADTQAAGILRQIGELIKDQKPTTLEQKKAEYNPNQGAFNYDAIQTRPGTTDRQFKLGLDAYRQRIQSIVERAGGSLLATSIAKDFRERGGAALLRQTVKSSEDLAVLAQIYRDPRFETFRIFFTKEGRIVFHTGITSRLPGSVRIILNKDGESEADTQQRFLDNLSAQKKASGADGYYLLHNHPSGTAKPSSADEQITQWIANGLPGFLSHIVIDHNEFGTINSKGESLVTKRELTGGYSAAAAIPHNALRMNISGGPSALAEVGKLIERKNGFFSIIGLSAQLDVVAIADIPLSVISSKSNLRLHAMLRMFARNSGSLSIAVVADDIQPFEKAVNAGIIIDAVSNDGDSARKQYHYPGDKLFGDNTKSIQTKQKGNNSYSSASWDAPEPSKIDNIIYTLQNKHVDLKRVVDAIKTTGAQLADQWNTYLQEELFHGRAAKRTQDFVNRELKPIMLGMKLRGQTVEELDKYLHARHAEEANNLIAQRDPNMPDGGSGMTTKDAKDYLSKLPTDKRTALENTAKKIDAVIAATRNLYVSYGLIDKETADSWEKMFKHYVPLMREDHDGGMGIGQGFSIKGKEAKHRTGSKRKVVDILANIALQRERAIVRGEKNRVAVSLAGLAKLNPNPDFWTFDKIPTEKVLNEATGQVEERPVPMFKNRDNVIVAKVKDSKGNVIERAVIFNEQDERAMRMAQAMKNLDATQLEGLIGVSAMITRYFAAINTQYNPIFGVINLTRDLQASLLNLSSTAIAGHKAQVLKNIGPAIVGIYRASRVNTKGKAQVHSPMADLWDEMQKEGGMTGYRDLFKTSEDRANAIKNELDPTAWMNSGLGKVFTAGGTLKVPLAVAQKKAKWIFDWLSDYNQTLEGAMRLSVYKTAIDNGISKPRAASIAKNISVNFNRKGQSGQQAGALYAFFNAAMQGTARIGETMTTMEKGDIKTFKFNRAGKTIIAGGITLGAMQALALAAAGFDDDEPPEFIRERNLIIPIGDKKYITVPMPLGFHAIPNIGRLSTEFALGGFKKPVDYTAKLFSVFAEAFNPIGNAGMSIQTLAPTAIDPLVALAENKDWTGKPIAKEDFNKLSPTPGFSRNKDTASDPSKWIAEAINTLSGGNKYVPGVASPTADQIDYLFGQVSGGVGREAMKGEQSIKAMATGEDLPPHKIPLVGRFYGDSSGQTSQGNAFYSNLKRINEVEAELKGRRKDRLPVDEFKSENPEYRLVVRANLIERLVSKQRKIKSDLIKRDAPREQVKAVDERITKLMTGLNDRVKTLKQEQQTAN